MTLDAVPYGLPTAAGTWQTVDVKRASRTTPPAEDGRAEVVFEMLDRELWLIDRAVSHSTADAGALRLYEGQESPSALLSGTASGGFDEAEYPGGLLITQGTQLLAVWTQQPDGAVCTLGIQYRVLRQG